MSSTRRKLIYWTINAICLGVWTILIGCQMYFAYTRPVYPQPPMGRIYPFRVHYTTVYLTSFESRLVNFETVMSTFVIVAAVLIVNYRYGPYYRT